MKNKDLGFKKNCLMTKGMLELAHMMWGGGARLHFWFKSSNFLGARLIRFQIPMIK